MPKSIHVAIGSTLSRPGAVEDNLAQIAAHAWRAAADGADLLLTPELSVSGYGPYPEVLATAEPAGDGPIHQALARLAADTGVVVAAGLAERDAGRTFLVHEVVFPDGSYVVQRKNRVTLHERPFDTMMQLVPERKDDEIGQPTGAPTFETFSVRGVRCAVAICADNGVRDLDPILARAGVELLLGPSGAGGRRQDRIRDDDLRTEAGRETYAHWLEQTFFPGRDAIRRCLQWGRAQAAVNLCGFDGKEKYHIGHGTIINPMGEILAVTPGMPNLDRQRPAYAHAVVDVEDRLCAPEAALG